MEIFFDQNFFSKKKKLRNFFIGKISDFFFKNFFKTCLYNSSKGTKNNQKKIFSSFREIWEKLEKIFAKKGIFDFDEIFWKKNIPIFFWEYSKTRAEPSFKSYKKSYEKLSSSFQDISKKKKVDRPSIHPIHPSIRPSVNIKNRERKKGRFSIRNLKSKKWVGGEYKKERDSNGTPSGSITVAPATGDKKIWGLKNADFR